MPAIPVSNSLQESAAEIAAQQSSEELGTLPSVFQNDARLGVPPNTDPSILAVPEGPTTNDAGTSAVRKNEDNTSELTPSSETETTASVEQVPAGPNENEFGQSDWISGYIWIPLLAIPVLAWLVFRWLSKRQSDTDKTERETRVQEKTRDAKQFDINSNTVSSTFDQSLDELDDFDLGSHDQATISSAATLVAGTHGADHDSVEGLETFSVADAKSFDFNAELDEFESACESNITPVLEGKLTDDANGSIRMGPVPAINHPTMRAENPQFDLEDSFVIATSSSRIPSPNTFNAEIQMPRPGQPAFTAGPRSVENEFAFDEEEDDDLDDDSELDLEFQVLEGVVSIELETESNLEFEAEIEASESNMNLLFAAETDGHDLMDHDLGETISLDEDDSDAGYDFDIERMMELEDSDSSLDLGNMTAATADLASEKSADDTETEENFNLNRPSSIAASNADSQNFFNDDSGLDSNLTIEVALDEIEDSSGIESDLDLPNSSSPKDTLSAPDLFHTPPHFGVAANSGNTAHRVPETSPVQRDPEDGGLDQPVEFDSRKAPSAADTIRDEGFSIVEPEFEKERFSILQSQIDELERENELLNSALMSARIESERLDESEKQNLKLAARLDSLNRDLEQAQTIEQARDELQKRLDEATDEKESLVRDLERATSQPLNQPLAAGNTESAKPVSSAANSTEEPTTTDPEFYKRFELRLKKEYKKRKQAERELEQAEEHRNELSKSLRETRLELKQIQENALQNETLAQRIEQLESQLRSQAIIPDDLIRINGIGPVIKRKLHEIGVTSFDQIAGWDDDVAAEIETKLNLRGKIKRENWVEQAMAFAAEKSQPD